MIAVGQRLAHQVRGHELQQRIGGIQRHVLFRIEALRCGAPDIPRQVPFKIEVMRLRGDDDGSVSGFEAGADEARDLIDEVRVTLVELNEMLDHFAAGWPSVVAILELGVHGTYRSTRYGRWSIPIRFAEDICLRLIKAIDQSWSS